MPGFAPNDETTAMGQAVAMVRLYMRDYPELNRLIDGEESSPRMIAWAILDTLDDFNSMPPLIGAYTITNFPSKSLLRIGTVAHLMESISILATRNFISFSDGGTSVSFTARLPHLMNLMQMFRNQWEQKVLKLKVALNISQGFGAGVHSDYILTSSGYGPW